MSMTSLRFGLSFLKREAPFAATHPGLSDSSRGPPAGAMVDLRMIVRASPQGQLPWTSYSSHSNCPVQLPGDFIGLSHEATSISLRVPLEHQMLIAASGVGLLSSEDEDSAGLPSLGATAPAESDPELKAMLARAVIRCSSPSTILPTLDDGKAR